MQVIQPGNIITMIGKSLYGGFNAVSVGVFGVPAAYVGMFLASILGLFVLLMIFTAFKKKNSFSLDSK